MGLGDWIMSTATAREVNIRTGRKVAFSNGERAFWHDQIFTNNPRLSRRLGPDVEQVFDYPGHRPYVKQVTSERFIFNPDFRVRPGELYIDRPTKADYIVVEPHVKRGEQLPHGVPLMVGHNKDWGLERWREVVKLDLPWVQLGTHGEAITRRIRTEDFRSAAKVLAGARLFVGTDGALHHAAAALGIPAVVVWGGLASPVHLGYASHINLWSGADPCGTHSKACEHCKQALAMVSVEEVRDAVERAYERSQRHLVA